MSDDLLERVSADEVTLSDLDQQSRRTRFAGLQARLPSVWDAMRQELPDVEGHRAHALRAGEGIGL